MSNTIGDKFPTAQIPGNEAITRNVPYHNYLSLS